MQNGKLLLLLTIMFFSAFPAFSQPGNMLQNLAVTPDFESHRISSADKTGGNADWISIEPGETKVLAEIEGPGAITHIWNTISAERYYPRMLILRIYWDGQEVPSVEAPLGDFFGVGHGLERAFQSFPVDVSSDGRARNCYWFMPFKKSAKVTVTHEGFEAVRSFYYYIDYQTFTLHSDALLYFHAQYRQATPNPKVDVGGKNLDGKANYLLLDTQGTGRYVGTVLSVQTNQDGWFGEGDDMFFVDSATTPTLTGTGTEDYFNDAWGFREFAYPFHGVTLWEGYRKGDRGTAYKWHIFDPVAFAASLRVTIEHGHANDRQDDFYSTAFWYQTLPGPTPPPMPNVLDRLPDEGRLYAKQIFLNKELGEYQKQGRLENVLTRMEEFLKENEHADDYGYVSLRKGVIFKQLSRYPEAVEAFKAALTKSQKKEPKAKELDAESIQWLAERETPVVEKGKSANLYMVGDDTYEVFLDGRSIAKGGGGDRLDTHEIKSLSGGTHLLAVRCENKRGKAGLALQLSYRRGTISVDSSWKVATSAADNWDQKKYDDSQWKNAEEIGILGESPWRSTRQPYNFAAPILAMKVIWMPEGAKENQTAYFRKVIQLK